MDGSFKGKLTSTGDLVIGATGVIRGNISDLREVRPFSNRDKEDYSEQGMTPAVTVER